MKKYGIIDIKSWKRCFVRLHLTRVGVRIRHRFESMTGVSFTINPKTERHGFMSNQQNRQDPAVLELIRRAQAGDEAAFSELFAQYAHLIDAQCEQYEADAPSEQELRSEAIAAFWHATSKYDTEQLAVTFGLYAQICIGNQLISCLRKWRRMGKTVPLDSAEIEALGAGEDSNPAYYVVEKEQYLALREKMEEALSKGEREVWLLFIAGRTAAEIAQMLKKDKKSVENAIFRARKKLRAAIPERP